MSNGKPRYQCIYIVEGKERILIGSLTTERGVEPRYFTFWPGLFRHHHEFGDGSDITVGEDFIVTTEVRGLNEIPTESSEKDND
jgi:hypothetical protein